MCKILTWSNHYLSSPNNTYNFCEIKFIVTYMASKWCTSRGSRNCGCIVFWFCYQLIVKPGNKTAAVLWPDPYDVYKVMLNVWSHFKSRLKMLQDDVYNPQWNCFGAPDWLIEGSAEWPWMNYLGRCLQIKVAMYHFEVKRSKVKVTKVVWIFAVGCLLVQVSLCLLIKAKSPIYASVK